MQEPVVNLFRRQMITQGMLCTMEIRHAVPAPEVGSTPEVVDVQGVGVIRFLTLIIYSDLRPSRSVTPKELVECFRPRYVL